MRREVELWDHEDDLELVYIDLKLEREISHSSGEILRKLAGDVVGKNHRTEGSSTRVMNSGQENVSHVAISIR